MNLSIVTTLFRSEIHIERFIDEAIDAGEMFGGDFEVIVVDDGSPDKSRAIVERRADLDSRIRVIELARNFGHHPAFWCGMHYARGEYCFLIDSDLEVRPSVLLDFQNRMVTSEADVVYGVQELRRGSIGNRVLGGLFWKIFSVLSDVTVPEDIMTERLMNRKYIDALLSMGDNNLFLGGMFFWPGFRQVPLFLVKLPRPDAGAYSFINRFKLLVNAISSFSSTPLTFIFWLGVIVFLISALYFVYLLSRRLFFPESLLDGFTFLALVSTGASGLVLMAVGVIGLYVHRIFKQVQARPIFVVRNIYSKDEE